MRPNLRSSFRCRCTRRTQRMQSVEFRQNRFCLSYRSQIQIYAPLRAAFLKSLYMYNIGLGPCQVTWYRRKICCKTFTKRCSGYRCRKRMSDFQNTQFVLFVIREMEDQYVLLESILSTKQHKRCVFWPTIFKYSRILHTSIEMLFVT
jgi:hypothetical protein